MTIFCIGNVMCVEELRTTFGTATILTHLVVVPLALVHTTHLQCVTTLVTTGLVIQLDQKIIFVLVLLECMV